MKTKISTNTTSSKQVKTFYFIILVIISVLSLIFLSLINSTKAATYYYISGPLNSLSSWKTGSNGTGSSPTSFTGNNTFIIWNSLSSTISPTLTTTWNFGGTGTTYLQIGTSTGSATLVLNAILNLQGGAILRIGATTGTNPKQLIILPSGNLNITSSATTPLRVYNNATVTIQSTSFPASNQVALNAGSTVEWAQNSGVTIWRKTYRNMIISGTGIKTQGTGGTTQITGQLILQSGGLQMSNTTTDVLRLSGTIAGTAPIITGNSNLRIDGSGTFGTIYFAGSQTIRNLTIYRTNASGHIILGSNLIVNGTTTFTSGNINLNGKTLTLNGAITFPTNTTNGYFTGSNASQLIIGGSGSITNSLLFNQSNNSTRSLYQLTMNRTGRTLTLGNLVHIWGSLNATAGTINCGNNLCYIKANNTLKGRVGPIGTNADITGTLTVEAFAKGGTTGWAMLGANGVSGRTFVDWNDDFAITCPACPNGSVVGNTPFTSIGSYSEPAVTNCYSCAPHYVYINSINDPITVGKGYYVYLGTSTYTTSDIVIDLTGSIVKKNFGAINLTLTGSASNQNGWNLIANPYPSPVSFTTAFSSYSTQIEYATYVWNPDLNGGNGDHVVYIPGVGSIPSVASGGIDDNIPLGQAFFVRALVNNVNIYPSESWKTATINTNPLLKTFDPNSTNNTVAYPSNLFVLNLKGGGSKNFNTFTAINLHPNGTLDFDNGLDATHINSDYDYYGNKIAEIYTIYNNTQFKCNTIPLSNGTYSLEVKVLSGYSGTYTISPINLNNLPQAACVTLFDKFTNTTHDLRNGDYVFNFSDTTSVSRFILYVNFNPISAIASVIQPATCKTTADAIITTSITGTPPFIIQWKDSLQNVIATHTTNFNTDTLFNATSGTYYIDVASSASCSGSLIPISINYTTPLPIASANLLTSNTMSCNLSNPFVFNNTSVNASNFQWIVLGNGTSATTPNFTCMPLDTGDYIVRLYAFNSCNDTSFVDFPITVLPGPDMNIPHFYGPCPPFMPGCQTAKTIHNSNTNNNDNAVYQIQVLFTDNEYYLLSNYDTEVQLVISDIIGRILFNDKIYLRSNERFNVPINSNYHNQWLILKVFDDKQKINSKIWAH
ncbi:MAG: hypothetical protein KatS3mg027_0461 [Bacteroidia bacterium]|nr:MAG: hypothetical protein KatS3mg027_0461 [Bacteroidia bacterium]